jgi:hypothetical protein
MNYLFSEEGDMLRREFPDSIALYPGCRVGPPGRLVFLPRDTMFLPS